MERAVERRDAEAALNLLNMTMLAFCGKPQSIETVRKHLEKRVTE